MIWWLELFEPMKVAEKMPENRAPGTAAAPSLDIQINVSDARWNSVVDPEDLSRKAVDAALGFVSQIVDRDCELSILFCDDAEIQDINHRWRSIDKPTNVLSFPGSFFSGQPGPMVLGDIAITLDTCQREAQEGGLTLADHATHLLVHGFLHLAGFDHENDDDAAEMEALETEILASMGIADPYREPPVRSAGADHV